MVDSLPQRRCMDRPTKVCNFQLSTIAKEQIFWLDITVNHLLLMTVDQGIGYLLHELITVKRFAISFNFLDRFRFFLNPNYNSKNKNKSNKSSLWLYAGRQIFRISVAPCTFHHVEHTRAPSTPFSGRGNNCRSARCLGA